MANLQNPPSSVFASRPPATSATATSTRPPCAVRKLRSLSDAKEATKLLPEVNSMLDKLAKRNIIHANKAAKPEVLASAASMA